MCGANGTECAVRIQIRMQIEFSRSGSESDLSNADITYFLKLLKMLLLTAEECHPSRTHFHEKIYYCSEL